LPATARLLTAPGETLIATTATSGQDWRDTLIAAGATVLTISADAAGRVDLSQLWQTLGERGVLSVLIEGGSTIMGSAFAAGGVQRVEAFIAPLIIGGKDAPGPVGDPGFGRLADAAQLLWQVNDTVGGDVWLGADVISVKETRAPASGESR
jgi:diaminohydroxyphosphoribosylaminopyrimidine deaminase / 5-amino-6-(5-phosphoribosylamino)uracil reductase